MSDSSSEDECPDHPSESQKYILFRNRPEWKDVVPVSQDDGPNPIVAIAYSEKFKDCYDYFRAILQSQEKSERALELTEVALHLNPANYTVWQYRRVIIKQLDKDLDTELKYIKNVITEHPKNYQVWHHRRVIVEWKQDPSLELELTSQMLELDAKNYHAWQHRQWVIKTFSLFDNELAYTETLLKSDVRNNSAWNQRYFVISNTTGYAPAEVIEREVNFTCDWIQVATYNESAWNYLRGVLTNSALGLDGHSGVRSMCEKLRNSGNKSPTLLSFMVDMLTERMHKTGDQQILETIHQLCNSLATEHDTIRAQYWNYRSRNTKLK